MFRVGENRRPLKQLPGVAYLTVARAEGTPEEPKELKELEYCYCLAKFKAHDDQKTAIKKVDSTEDGRSVVAWHAELPPRPEFEFDFPHFEFEDFIEVQLWKSRTDDSDPAVHEEDILVARQRIPTLWVLNMFGLGYGGASEERVLFRLKLEGDDIGKFPYEVDLQMGYQRTEKHTAAAKLRWCSLPFEGKYVLDRAASSDMEPLLRQTGVPFVLRKLEEVQTEERLQIKVMGGGKRVQFIRLTDFYEEDTSSMEVNELFQSVKTFSGHMVEKRLYWDYSSMVAITPDQPYPTAILMAVTKRENRLGELVEALDLSPDGTTLTQLAMVDGTEQKFRKVFTKQREKPRPVFRAPHVVTRKGTLVVAALRGKSLTPDEEDASVNAYAALKLLEFANRDEHYERVLNEDDAAEQQTRSFDSDPNPEWNQIFQWPVRSNRDSHHVLVVHVWNRTKEDEEVLIGSVRIPVPWIYNSFGCEIGPALISSYEATFKLKRTDVLDPTEKIKYGNVGRVVLRIAYTHS